MPYACAVYRIQQEAPRARAVLCQCPVPDTPPEYGSVFHGALSSVQAADILTHDGDYLVRLSSNIYTLSLRYNLVKRKNSKNVQGKKQSS